MLFDPTINLATSAAVEGVAFLDRLVTRKAMYGRARARAIETGKPLVVVGAPMASGSLSQYRCGDLPCIDLEGCSACAAPPRDVTVAGAIPVQDGGAVVLVQYVLEYVENIDGAWAEIKRAAGRSGDVFVSRVQDWATFTRLMTGCKRIIKSAPPNDTGELTYKRVRRDPKLLSKGKAAA